MNRIDVLATEIENLELQRAVVFQKMKPLQDEVGRLHQEIEIRHNERDEILLTRSTYGTSGMRITNKWKA